MRWQRRDPNEFRWRRGAWRNGHGDTIRGRVFIVGDYELADDSNPPSASLDPDADTPKT